MPDYDTGRYFLGWRYDNRDDMLRDIVRQFLVKNPGMVGEDPAVLAFVCMDFFALYFTSMHTTGPTLSHMEQYDYTEQDLTNEFARVQKAREDDSADDSSSITKET